MMWLIVFLLGVIVILTRFIVDLLGRIQELVKQKQALTTLIQELELEIIEQQEGAAGQ